MRNELLFVAALAAAPCLCIAQEKKAPATDAAQMPDPKTKEHEALKNLAGDWDVTCKMSAMPGVPGMEKAQESVGTEHAELICNGLFLKSVTNSTYQGKPFQGVWIAGYDPFEKKYTSIWVCTEDEPASTGTGTYDEKTRTWSFVCSSQHGPARSTLVFKDNDNSVETCYMQGADGKETQAMELTRKRSTRPAAARPVEASAKAPSKELEGLYDSVGTWNATVKMSASADHPANESTAVEKNTPICGGKWIWSDFIGTVMGAPFEGHGLYGYDATDKQCVSFWIDSMGATYMKTTGACDAAKKTSTLDGKCVDEKGNPINVHQVLTQTDANTRNLKMTFKGEKGTEEMDITYKKAPAGK